MSRFTRPETVRLEISGGDWLLVKKRLSEGERREAWGRNYQTGADGTLSVKPLYVPVTMVAAYLLDWSLTDDDGKQVVIRDIATEALIAILDNLQPLDFAEIKDAIEAHERAMLAERAQEKKPQGGVTGAATISSSPSAAAGPPMLSVN